MITEQSYWPVEVQGWVDILETFSPFDHGVIAGLSELDREQAIRACLLRVACLLNYHGQEVPGKFVDDLRTTLLASVGELIACYLDNGARTGDRKRRELQQELLHFSRITDVEAIWRVASKRLRNSKRLGGELRIAIEFAAVVRSRCAAWGAPTAPYYRTSTAHPKRLEDRVVIELPAYGFVATVDGGRRRFREEYAYLLAQSLDHVRPDEAMWILASVLSLQKRFEGVRVTLVGSDQPTLKWRHPGSGLNSDPVNWVAAALPHIEPDGALAGWTSPRHANGPSAATDLCAFITDAAEQLAASCQTFITLECGHIHLDREFDGDQEVGLRIARYTAKICATQVCPPRR